MNECYYVYILRCSDGSYYTGLTNNLVGRLEQHVTGFFETCFTFSRRPVVLVYFETIPFLEEAKQREQQIKNWSRRKKEALIKRDYHRLQLFAQCQNLSHNMYKDIDKGRK